MHMMSIAPSRINRDHIITLLKEGECIDAPPGWGKTTDIVRRLEKGVLLIS